MAAEREAAPPPAEVAVKHKDGYINTDVLRSFTGESDATKPSDAALF